jgi:hypothetical protein
MAQLVRSRRHERRASIDALREIMRLRHRTKRYVGTSRGTDTAPKIPMNLPPNPYAPPTEPRAIPYAGHGAPWQAYAPPNLTFRTHGTDAIIAIGAYLPDVCVKCCRKEGLTRRSFPLTRHPTWLYGLLALGLLPYFVVRSGFARGWASFCLCGYCYTRYQNAGLAKWVLALPVLTWTSMLGSLWALGLEGLERGDATIADAHVHHLVGRDLIEHRDRRPDLLLAAVGAVGTTTIASNVRPIRDGERSSPSLGSRRRPRSRSW